MCVCERWPSTTERGGNERDLGYVLLNAGGDTGFFRVSVSVCYQLRCSGDKWSNPGANVVVDIYKWYP